MHTYDSGSANQQQLSLADKNSTVIGIQELLDNQHQHQQEQATKIFSDKNETLRRMIVISSKTAYLYISMQERVKLVPT